MDAERRRKFRPSLPSIIMAKDHLPCSNVSLSSLLTIRSDRELERSGTGKLYWRSFQPTAPLSTVTPMKTITYEKFLFPFQINK